MQNSITLKIPSNLNYFELIKQTIEKLSSDIHFTIEDRESMITATKELVENSIVHSYKEHIGFVEVSFHPFEYGLRIDVMDWGFPMTPLKQSSVPIDLQEDKGFNKVYNLTDKFEYVNLGKEGKKFTIIKYSSHPHRQKVINLIEYKKDEKKEQIKVEIRRFAEGDEESVSKLIYQNYGHSYVKNLFYFPMQILEFEGKKFFSIVALVQGKIIGHFALVNSPKSNIAEIGVVVVDPKYKGHGIMNKMFDELIKLAQELELDAIYGEAIMYHVFSQKSNLTHKFYESAILMGKIPAEVEIEQNLLTKKHLRGSALVGYKIFNYKKKRLNIPKIYHNQIVKTYQNANLDFDVASTKKVTKNRYTHLYYDYDPLSEIAIIKIDICGKYFEHKFVQVLRQLRAKHCHMIYADICMQSNSKNFK